MKLSFIPLPLLIVAFAVANVECGQAFSKDGEAAQALEHVPGLGFLVGGVHLLAGNPEEAERAVDRCGRVMAMGPMGLAWNAIEGRHGDKKSTSVALKTRNNRYLRAHDTGFVDDTDICESWETFEITHIDEERVHIKNHHGKYLCAHPDGKVEGSAVNACDWEIYRLQKSGGDNQVVLMTHHGSKLKLRNGVLVAEAEGEPFSIVSK